MPYVTKEQIENARKVDIISFLQQFAPGELIPTGPNAYKLKSHDSLKISNGKWCWWSHDKMGGINALDYLIKVENMKFPEAVQLINEQCGIFHAQTRTAAPTQQRAEFVLPVRAETNRRITAYLLSRGIDIAVLDYCFQSDLLYESADYHNVVFVGYDGKKPRYATLRGATTNSHFRRDVTGSNKAYCFSISAQSPDAPLHVFECAIDALSYLTQVKLAGRDFRSQSVLSLGGVYEMNPNTPLPVALQGYLNTHRETKEIVLRLDNDRVGRCAAQAIRTLLNGYRVSVALPEQGKDYNEWLMLQKGISPRHRTAEELER